MNIIQGNRYKDEKISGGPEVCENSMVLLLYKLALSENDLCSGKLLESTYSPDIPVSVKVNEANLLKGIYKGILGMRGGGSVRHIIIPPEEGFGEKGYGNVPPNATLYAEICIVAVEPSGEDYGNTENF